ncbi:hypothetical protein LMJF_33_3080 [Leishmania major strain Friedlin]|uniref:Flagellar attachment zone protein 1 conserved domain-containing protein n=1 Tax=Leishmania major TaxID=5664 RepID=Q4Q3M8_LEIMA|nr:hypothetical protein LMJF_33_3080 [Leishmania major strain Friedlin]CAG9581015.1 hypothetical_protein_-_conserved [Leishmania major strain Friedlin]CAJ06855.1 hypothetical protein LMJF_33_3080 [Leishmania major strain Friedlin]|eukprot:XP_001686070.1 hypothetical protein LMJF_33_3080 [Leishmania major strain Friedlin]
MAHLYVCHSAPPLAQSATKEGPVTYLDQVVSAATKGVVSGHKSERSARGCVFNLSSTSARRWSPLTERRGFKGATEESAFEYAESAAVDAASLISEPESALQPSSHLSSLPERASDSPRNAPPVAVHRKWPRQRLLPSMLTRIRQAHGATFEAATVTATAHHPYNDGQAFPAAASARGVGRACAVSMPTLAEAMKPLQQLPPSRPSPAVAPEPCAAAAASFASVQQLLINYEALSRRDLIIDFYAAYPIQPVVAFELSQPELPAAALRAVTRKPPPPLLPSPSTSEKRSVPSLKKATAAMCARSASSVHLNRLRLVFPGALWPFILRHHYQLLTRTLRRDVEASAFPSEAVEDLSLHAAGAEMEVTLSLKESPDSQSKISTTLSASSFAESWEVYNLVAFFFSREVPLTLPQSVVSPPWGHESSTRASTATTHAAVDEAASSPQPTAVPPPPLPPVLRKHQMAPTLFTQASLSKISAAAATSAAYQPLKLMVPLLFLEEASAALQKLIDTAPSQLRLALLRDTMYAVPDANDVQVNSWAVQPTGLYVKLLLHCADGNGMHVALDSETAINRCPYTETWDVIRSYTAGLASVAVEVPIVAKRCASTPRAAPASQQMNRSITATACAVATTVTAATPQSESFVCSASPCTEEVRRSWLLSEDAVLNASEYTKSEWHSVSTTSTVYSFIARNGAILSADSSSASANESFFSASPVAATSCQKRAVKSLKRRATTTTEIHTTPTIAPAIAPGWVNELTSKSLLTQTSSTQLLLCGTLSESNVKSIGVPRTGSATTRTPLLSPRVRPKKEDTSSVTDVLERRTQAVAESAANSSERFPPGTITAESTMGHPNAYVTDSMKASSAAKTANKSLLAPFLFPTLLPIPRNSSGKSPVIGHEQAASRVLCDADKQSAKSLQEDEITQAMFDREEEAAATELHDPFKPQLEQKPMSLSRYMATERQLAHQQQRISFEASRYARVADTGITNTESSTTPSPSEDTAMATDFAMQKADLDGAQGTHVSSTVGEKWETLWEHYPLQLQRALKEDVHAFFGVLTGAIAKVIVRSIDKLHEEVMGAPGVVLQPSSLERKAEASVTVPTTSHVFSPATVELLPVLRMLHMTDFYTAHAQRHLCPLRSFAVSSRCSAAEAAVQHRAVPIESLVDATAKAVTINQVEVLSPLSASVASSPAKNEPKFHDELSSTLQDPLLAERGNDVTKTAIHDANAVLVPTKTEMALQAVTVADGSARQADFSVPTAAPERSALLHRRALTESSAACAPVRVLLRRFFDVPGLTDETLAGELEAMRALFFAETCAVLDTPDDVVEDLQLSGHLTVHATVRLPTTNSVAEWCSLLLEHDYPKLNELLHEWAAARAPQAPLHVEAKVEPDAMSCSTLLSSCTLKLSPTASAAPVESDGRDASSHAVYVEGDVWPALIEQRADVLREALISDATAALSTIEASVHRVSAVPYANGALFTFHLHSHGSTSLRAVEDALQQCSLTAVRALRRRFDGTSRYLGNHKVTGTMYRAHLEGKAWKQVLEEHGDLLTETFVRDTLQCLRGSEDAAVSVTVAVTGIAAKPDGITIAYDVASTTACADVDRGRVAHAIMKYPFPQLRKMYDSFMLAREPLEHSKNALRIVPRHLSTAYDVAEVPNQRQCSHVGLALEMPLDPLEASLATLAPDGKAETAGPLTVGSKAEMMDGQKVYELNYLSAPAAVLAPPVVEVPREAAVVPSARASLVDSAQATEKPPPATVVPNVRVVGLERGRTEVDIRVANPPSPLPRLQTSLPQRSEPRVHQQEQQQQRRHEEQRRITEQPTNASEYRAPTYAATVSFMETEYEEDGEAEEDTASSESDGFAEHTAALPPTPLRRSTAPRPAVSARAAPLSTTAAPVIRIPVTPSTPLKVLNNAASVERRTPCAVRPNACLPKTLQSAAAPAVPSLSPVFNRIAAASSHVPVKQALRAASAPAQKSPLSALDSSLAGEEPMHLPTLYAEGEGKMHGVSRTSAPSSLARSPSLVRVCQAAPITVADVRMEHSPKVDVLDAKSTVRAVPILSCPRPSAHCYSGTGTAPCALLQTSQANMTAGHLYTAPKMPSSEPTSLYHSHSPQMITLASCSQCGSASKMRSSVLSSLPASPLPTTRMLPRHSSSFVFVATEPIRSLQRLQDDFDLIERAIRARYSCMQRELMATVTAALAGL